MRKIWSTLAAVLCFFILVPSQAFSQTNSGWYTPSVWYYAGAAVDGVALGDFNNDGLLDVVVKSQEKIGQDTLYVYHQNISGGMDQPVLYNLPNLYSSSVDVADLNNDNRDDIIVPCASGIMVLYQNTGGTLNDAVELFSGEYSQVWAVDIDEDNYVDVVAFFEKTVYVFRHPGGVWSAPVAYNSTFDDYISTIQVGDLNNDNHLDIIALDDDGIGLGEIVVFTQIPGSLGTFNAAVKYGATFSNNFGCVVGDLNKHTDSLKDLCVTGKNYYFNVLRQNGGNTLDNAVEYSTDTIRLNGPPVLEDVNRDGFVDVVAPGGEYMTTYFQQLDGSFIDQEFYPLYYVTSYHSQSVRIGDVNNDGINDVVIANNSRGMMVLYSWDKTNILTVQTPNGNEYDMGDTLYIKWESNKAITVDVVDVSYSLDGGGSWNVIVSNFKGASHYNWVVPYMPTDDLMIKVTSSQYGLAGVSKCASKILDDGVARIFVTEPNGGGTLVGDTTKNITWTTTGNILNVYIDYSTNNGTDWTLGTVPEINDGSYTWIVPDVSSTQCLIRIRDADSSASDTSNSTFTILEAGSQAITLLTPNGGETLSGGSNYSITWESTNVNQVALKYSIDNGITWNDITVTQASTGSYTWTVPAVNSSQCFISVSDSVDGLPIDTSNTAFSISTIVGPSITVLSPNGGEYLFIGRTHTITWESTSGIVGNVQIQYSINNGSSWSTIVASTANDGAYDWTVPNAPSSQCLIRIREASDLNPTDTSDAVFTIAEYGATLSITSPSNGNVWQVGSKHDITWISGENVSNSVKLEYSTNNKVTWKTIVSSTANDGKYTWTVPNAPSSKCNIRITDALDGFPTNISYGSFSIITDTPVPEIALNRTALYYVWVKSSTSMTPIQTITIDNSGVGELKWKAEVDVQDNDYDDESLWLKITNTGGTQSGQVGVYVEPVGLAVGTYDAAIKFTDTNAVNSPQSVAVILNVVAAGKDANPFGSFETPADGVKVMSSIPVTGWVVDDVGVDKVTVWRDAVAGEGKGEVYIGDAILVEGARPDVEQAYPTYPMSYQAGWGYMMLTNFLPNGGNGTFKIHAYAKDVGGNQVKLGSKTITCDNANAVKPFGAIDTPAQGGMASGVKYRNQGWALTPLPSKIPENGSTIKVYVDGASIGTATYNIYRADIARYFPGYNNSNGALAYLDFDTTAYENGIHTIQWVVTDNGAHTDGIGSRYFSIQNTGYNRQSSSATGSDGMAIFGVLNPTKKIRHSFKEVKNLHPDLSRAVTVITGVGSGIQSKSLTPGQDGVIYVTIRQDERLEINMNLPGELSHTGYVEVNNQLRSLPPGAFMDSNAGVFYWQPGPASFGKYPLVFVSTDSDGKIIKRKMVIEITSKY